MDHSSPPKSNTGNLGLSYMSLLDSIDKRIQPIHLCQSVCCSIVWGHLYMCWPAVPDEAEVHTKTPVLPAALQAHEDTI